LMIFIVLSAISSYMSITRNQETFKPKSWMQYRVRYFAHVNQKATDKPAPRPPTSDSAKMPAVPSEPYFKVASVRRAPKIEDEDEDDHIDDLDDMVSTAPLEENSNNPYSRTQSITSRTSLTNLPYGARRHRASWSSREFSQMYPDGVELRTASMMSVDNPHDIPSRHRAASQRLPSRTGPPPVLENTEAEELQSGAGSKRRATLDPQPSKRNSASFPEEEVETG